MKRARTACVFPIGRVPVVVTALVAFQVIGAEAGFASVQAASAKSSSALEAKKSAAKRGAKNKKSKKQKQAVLEEPAVIETPMPRVVAPLTPAEFVSVKVQKVLDGLKSRPLRSIAPPSNETKVDSPAEKAAWLETLYTKNMVEASWATEMIADKRILFGVVEREMGARATVYLPKTLGLREFLRKYNLVKANGELTHDGDRIEAALFEEFPSGFFVRPAVGVAPQETGKGLYPDTDQLVLELLKPESPIAQAAQMRRPAKSELLEQIASGESFVLQENVIGTADAHKPLKTRFFQEVRVHTYESRVIEGAVPSRWVQTDLLQPEQVTKAEAFVADFLKSMPLAILSRQAWGIDVAVMDNGDMRIVDVVTNRGKQIQWSSYLEQPRVLGAYARHFEQYYGWKFGGVSGTLIRNNFANYLPYWGKRIEKARPGFGKVMAYLPPVP